MEKFNQILGNIQQNGGCPQNDMCQQKDTTSDIGQSGTINPEEQEQDKVIIHLDSGIQISMPLEIAKMIAKALGTPEGTENQGE